MLSLRDDMVEIPAEKAESIITARNKKHDDKVEAVAIAPQPEEITPRVARIVDQINAWRSPSKPCIFSLSKVFGYKKTNSITKKERDQAWGIYKKQQKVKGDANGL